MTKIVIVDDDPDVVETSELVLKKEGFEVRTAGNRADGLLAVEQFEPDLLVLDVMMEQPDDGFAMAQQLRRKGFKAPILMLTSINRVTGMRFGLDEAMVPADGFLEKPVRPSVLVAKLRELLRKEG